jgi:hypothetical protein
MNIITENQMKLERLEQLFQENGLAAEIVENYPAEPLLNLGRDIELKVSLPDNQVLSIWQDTHAGAQLHFRLFVARYEECRALPDDELFEWIVNGNQNSGFFGMAAIIPQMGITLEYRLPYESGILDQTILNATAQLAKGGARARKWLHDQFPKHTGA